MPYLYAGALGFLVAFAFDVVALKGWRRAKPAIGGLSAVLLLYGFLGAALSPDRFSRPLWLAILGGLLAVCGAGLLFFSLFIEIPARRTYLVPGAGQELVTTGTYALCRHPGVLWFGLLPLWPGRRNGRPLAARGRLPSGSGSTCATSGSRTAITFHDSSPIMANISKPPRCSSRPPGVCAGGI